MSLVAIISEGEPVFVWHNVTRMQGTFMLTMRLYWPEDQEPAKTDGSWKVPGVKPAS